MNENIFSSKKDNTKKNLGYLDDAIKDVLKSLMEFKNQNKDIPVSINIQFMKEPIDVLNKMNGTEIDDFLTEVYEDLDSVVIEGNLMYLTLFLPYPINNLLFDIDEKRDVLIIAGNDISFYKEFHFKLPVKKETVEITHNNNILELRIELK